MLPLATERAIGEVVIRRLGAKWFIGVLLLSFVILFLLCTTSGPDASKQLELNLEHAFIAINIISLLLITVISATEIPYDISGRVLLVVLSKPIRRYQYVTGKCMGIMGAGLVYATISALFTLAIMVVMGYKPEYSFLQEYLLCIMRIAVASGGAILLSSSFSEVPTIAGCIAGGFFGLGINIAAMQLLIMEIPDALKVAVSSLLYIVPNLLNLAPPPTALADFIMRRDVDYQSLTQVEGSLDALFEIEQGALHLSFMYVVIYLAAFLAVAVLLFSKTEKVE